MLPFTIDSASNVSSMETKFVLTILQPSLFALISVLSAEIILEPLQISLDVQEPLFHHLILNATRTMK